MNGKTVTASILMGVVALFAALQYSQAASQPAATPTLKIGLVSVREGISGSKKYVVLQGQATKRAAQARGELEALARQADKEEGDLNLVKQGTADYVKQLQIALEARAKLQSQQELLKQQRMLEDKKVFEDLYQEILKTVETLAKEKGLDLVLERTEPKFPMATKEVADTVSTHKVLYAGGCVDLTSEVIARIDGGMNSKP